MSTSVWPNTFSNFQTQGKKCSCFPNYTLRWIIKKLHFKIRLGIKFVGYILISYTTIIIIYLTFFLITFFTPISVLPFLSGIINLGISSVRFQFKLLMRNLIYPLISIHPHSYWLAVWVPTGISIYWQRVLYLFCSVRSMDMCSLFMFICDDQ